MFENLPTHPITCQKCGDSSLTANKTASGTNAMSFYRCPCCGVLRFGNGKPVPHGFIEECEEAFERVRQECRELLAAENTQHIKYHKVRNNVL